MSGNEGKVVWYVQEDRIYSDVQEGRIYSDVYSSKGQGENWHLGVYTVMMQDMRVWQWR